MSDITTRHDADARAYLATLDGEAVGRVDYEDTAEGRVFTHSEIDPAQQGRGFGTAMVRAALDDTRAAGLTPIGQCSMVRHFLQKHPEYADATGR